MRLIALDLVRFFAALSVVLYHYTATPSSSFDTLSELTKFGYLGVPLFFMISGYVIALSANNRTAFEFAISRFVRLYPTFWASIGFTVFIVFLYGEHNYTWAQILANLTMLNNYFGVDNLDGVYWTLQAELKFYACIFILLIFNIYHKIRIWLTVWLMLTVLHLLTNEPFFMGWFISPGYSSFFIAGIALHLIHKEGVNAFNQFILFSSLIISSFQGFEQASGFMNDIDNIDKSISVVIIWIFYLLLYFLVTEKIKCSKRNIYLTLGGITYPLYLIHSKAGKLIIDEYSDYFSEQVIVLMTTLFIIFVSWLIYIGIEKKISTPLKLFLLNLLGIILSKRNK